MKRQRSKGRPSQTELRFRTRGGRRKGAGRKPKGARAGVSHARRPALASRYPVHLTLRVRPHVWNLRSRRCFRVIARAFAGVRGRDGFRLVHYCVQGNHLHLLVEARDKQRLARAMQGLSVRLARGLNRLMQRTGPVFADRYHSRILRTPSEVRRALAYLLHNARRHAAQAGRPVGAPGIDPYSSGSRFDGWSGEVPSGGTPRGPPETTSGELVCAPRTWLLSVGWRRCGLIRFDEVPGVRRKVGGRRTAARQR